MLSVRILVAAVTVVMGVQAAPVGNTLQALAYLTQFGYIEGSTKEKGNLITEDSVNEAVAEFQKFAGLQQTGKLNNETVYMMSLPRCGVKDKVGHSADARKKRYALQGSRWRVRELTYKISKYPSSRLDKASVDTEVKKSFEVWSKHTNLKFVAKTSGRVHIEIRFEKGEHGDGDPFDGPGGTLAHAYFPIYGGDAHFDDTERWTINSYSGTNLFQVAAHEFGHSLGLSHSDVQSALMAPFYRGYQASFKLDTDDIRGIQALYGQKKDTDEPTKKPGYPVTKPSKPRPTEGDHEEGELCSDSTIDAIFKTANHKTYAFKGEFYWEVTDDGLADGYPRSITKDFKGLPSNIDAAFTWFNGKTYFFKGDQYWRFTEKSLDENYPKHIKQGFVGIPDKIDAAFVWSGNGKIYFFKGSKYWKFDPERSPSVTKDYPKEITNWNGIPKNIDAAFQWTNGYTYFFKGTNYWRFNDRNFAVDAANPPFPRSSAVWWFDCKSMSADGLHSGSLQTELQGDIYNDGMDVDNDEGDVNEHQPDNFSSPVLASNSRKFTISSIMSIVLLLGTLLLV